MSIKLGMFYNSWQDYENGEFSRTGIINERREWVEDVPARYKEEVENVDWDDVGVEQKDFRPDLAMLTVEICSECGCDCCTCDEQQMERDNRRRVLEKAGLI
jgi:hypothetical protein